MQDLFQSFFLFFSKIFKFRWKEHNLLCLTILVHFYNKHVAQRIVLLCFFFRKTYLMLLAVLEYWEEYIKKNNKNYTYKRWSVYKYMSEVELCQTAWLQFLTLWRPYDVQLWIYIFKIFVLFGVVLKRKMGDFFFLFLFFWIGINVTIFEHMSFKKINFCIEESLLNFGVFFKSSKEH